MLIIVVLTLLVPALIGVLFYERFKGYVLIWRKRIELLLVFAFMINLTAYATFWARGWPMLSWGTNDNSSAILIPVVVQYMAIALVTAVILAFVASLVRIRALGTPAEEDAADEKAAADKAAAAKAAAKKATDKAEKAPRAKKATAPKPARTKTKKTTASDTAAPTANDNPTENDKTTASDTSSADSV